MDRLLRARSYSGFRFGVAAHADEICTGPGDGFRFCGKLGKIQASSHKPKTRPRPVRISHHSHATTKTAGASGFQRGVSRRLVATDRGQAFVRRTSDGQEL